MFTGLVQDIGTVTRLTEGADSRRLTVRCAFSMDEVALGESIALNGACYTVAAKTRDSFEVDVSPESLARTTTGHLQRGDRVHLERALRLGDRLGGHLVLGHVDGVGALRRRVRQGSYWHLAFSAPDEVVDFLIPKGSVAVDGVSLTINEVGDDGFGVMVVPHTTEQTRLAELRVGEQVNLEGDLIGKYVARLLGRTGLRQDDHLEKLLKDSGFM